MAGHRIPSYRLHRPSGQAVVTLGGKDRYLGKHDTPESHAEYRRLTGLYVAGGFSLPETSAESITIDDLLVRFWRHAERHYQKRGKPTTQRNTIRVISRRLLDLYGTTPAALFRPSDLKAVRETWVKDGNTRSTVNRKTAITKQIFDWAVESELIPGSVAHALRAVKGLRRERTTAPDPEPWSPVPLADVEATLPFLHPAPAAMVRLQLLTGMRAGEACQVRACDLDRSGPVWLYTPASHKSEHHGKDRMIAIGPKAQSVLEPFLAKCPADCFCFKTQNNLHPVCESNYWMAIRRATRRAGVQPWCPSRLRHNAATEFRKEFGLDAAQVMLGHSHADVTQIYAEANRDRMAEIAAKIG